LKIVSYNIFEGMTLDTTSTKIKFSAWVNQINPDILALQEVNKFTQLSLETLARSFNHPYAVLLKEKGFPVALTSKYPIVNVEKVIDNMHHGFIKAEINGYNIIVLHLSPHKYWKRREEIEVILQTIKTQPNQKKTMIMGDFNSFSVLDADAYSDGKIRQKLIDMGKKYSYHDNLVNGELDYEVHNKILNFGLVDAIKLKNKAYNSSRPTVKSSNNGENASSRIDYIYVSKDLKNKVVTAGIIKDAFTDIYSDHYPVYLELKK
jgi:exodeoxyribonuclease-3